MGEADVPGELLNLVRKVRDDYLDSEIAIAEALAAADGPLSIDELVDETEYTKRTVKKRVESLVENLQGQPLIRYEDGEVELHEAVREAFSVAEVEAD